MIGSSKILTVSYGTFSCTLEGFDDSFSTMKAIAEYFRDLAADDRYFGAEPPTPDAEMLARIAEREIDRRVEARTSAKGIVLRAADALPQAAEVKTAAEVETSVTTDGSDPAPAIAAAEPAVAQVVSDDVVAPVAEVEPIAPATPEPAMPPQVQRPANVAAMAVATMAKPQMTPAMHAMDTASDLTFEDMTPVATPASVPVNPDPESVAAKLQRIRAVTGKAKPLTDTYAEDQDARDTVPEAEETYAEDITGAASFFEDKGAPSDDVADQDAITSDLAETDDQSDAIAPQQAPIADLPEAAPDAAEETADMAPTADAEETFDDLELSELDDDGAEDFTDDLEDMARLDGVDHDLIDDAEGNETEAEDAAMADDAPEAEMPAQASDDDTAPSHGKPTIRARIVRLRQGIPLGGGAVDAASSEDEADLNDMSQDADLPEMPAAQSLDMVADTTEDSQEDDTHEDGAMDSAADDRDVAESAELDDIDDFAAQAMPTNDSEPAVADTIAESESGLSPEDEAALLEELADVARDIEATPVPARLGRDILPENDDSAMSRIMSQTDQELSDPEGSRRRNAIAQLKAAVVATEAARQLGDKSTQAQEDENAFRADLDQVVRPRRPARVETEETRTARPRPAPLKLVASQRVDSPAPVNTAPVQPRRVAMSPSDAPIQSEAGSFAEFAAQMGATELPDLLEAAAAYTAFVEGSEDFSRPQIMKKVQLTVEEEFSREDGLRSFGTLLRQGRISKVRNGRFQISDQTRFRPEPRAAQG